MNAALHITYSALLLAIAARRNRISGTAHDFSTGELTTLGILIGDAMESAWNRPRGKNWLWPFVIQSATLTVTSGAIAPADINYGPWISLWSADPRPESSTAYRVPVRLRDSSGIYPADNLSSVFALYFNRAPEFNSTAHGATTAYAVGDVVYDATTGNCYRCKATVGASSGILLSNATYWEEMLIPREFYTYLVETVQAEYHRACGQPDTAALCDARAQESLEQEFIAAKDGPTGSGKPWTVGGTWQ